MVIHIENIRYTESTAFDERVQLADKLNEIINALNAWGDVPVDIEVRMQALEAKEGKQNQDIATANTQSSQALREATSAKAIANTAKTTADNAKATADSTIAKSDIAIEDSSKALAKTVTLDGKTDATNSRVGALEQSEGQQEALIGKNINDIQRIKDTYFRKDAIHDTQIITGRADFKINPFTVDVKKTEYTADGGERMTNINTVMKIASATISPNSWAGRSLKWYDAVAIATRGCFGTVFENTEITVSAIYFEVSAFANSNITKLKMTAPFIAYMEGNVFQNCRELKTVEYHSDRISQIMFSSCKVLDRFVIRKTDKIVTLANENAFNDTPIATGTGYVYVPDALVNEYKTTTNWVVYADQIKPISEFPAEASA